MAIYANESGALKTLADISGENSNYVYEVRTSNFDVTLQQQFNTLKTWVGLGKAGHGTKAELEAAGYQEKTIESRTDKISFLIQPA